MYVGHICHSIHMEVEDDVVPGDQLQVIALGGKHIYLLSHHIGSPVKPLFLIVEKFKMEEL